MSDTKNAGGMIRQVAGWVRGVWLGVGVVLLLSVIPDTVWENDHKKAEQWLRSPEMKPEERQRVIELLDQSTGKFTAARLSILFLVLYLPVSWVLDVVACRAEAGRKSSLPLPRPPSDAITNRAQP